MKWLGSGLPLRKNNSRSEECPCSCQGRPIRANCQAGDTLFEVTGTVTSAQNTFPVFEDNVIELNLGNNIIEEIKEDCFNNATIPLAELKLFNCSIATISDNAFRPFFSNEPFDWLTRITDLICR